MTTAKDESCESWGCLMTDLERVGAVMLNGIEPPENVMETPGIKDWESEARRTTSWFEL